MAPTVTQDGILIVLDQDAHGQRVLPLRQVILNDSLAPIQRLVRGPRALHVPLRRSPRHAQAWRRLEGTMKTILLIHNTRGPLSSDVGPLLRSSSVVTHGV